MSRAFPRIGVDCLTCGAKGGERRHAIRNHWRGESMHWALEVVFAENISRKRVYNAAENHLQMMKVVLSLLRYHKKKAGRIKSLARMRKQAVWNTGVPEEILFSAFDAKNETGERQ